MSDEKREQMKKNFKKNLENDFDRREYENKILESLKKAKISTGQNKFPKKGDRGGR